MTRCEKFKIGGEGGVGPISCHAAVAGLFIRGGRVKRGRRCTACVCVCVCVCVVDTYKYERPIHFRRGSPKRARTAADFIFKFPADVCGVRM